MSSIKVSALKQLTRDIDVSVEIVDPEFARKALDHTHPIRKISPNRVKFYAQEMRDGKWKLNGIPIILDEDGKSIDCHHRLRAVIEANMAIPMLVARGVPRSVIDTIDKNRTRSFSDTMSLQSIPNSHVISTMLKIMHDYILCGALESSHIRREYVMESIYDSCPDEIQAAVKIGSGNFDNFPNRGRLTGIVALILLSDNSMDDIGRFMDDLSNGGKGDSPALKLYRFLINARISLRKTPFTYIGYTFIKAFNATMQKKEVKMLRYIDSEGHILIHKFHIPNDLDEIIKDQYAN